VKQRCGVVLGGSGCTLTAWMRQGSSTFANAKPGGGIWAKNPKPSVRGSVLGTPWETAVGGGAKRWWVRVDGMEVAGGLRVR
jgi:hypothetical protein